MDEASLVAAVLENLADCERLSVPYPVRRVPETLCTDIEAVLRSSIERLQNKSLSEGMPTRQHFDPRVSIFNALSHAMAGAEAINDVLLCARIEEARSLLGKAN